MIFEEVCVMAKGVSGQLLGAAMEASARIAEHERDDIDTLPPGHPVRVAIEEARKRHDARMEQEERRQVKRARKVGSKKDQNRKAAERERQRQSRVDELAGMAKDVNHDIDTVIGAVERMLGSVNDVREEFQDCPSASVRLAKLERLSVGFSRAVMDAKLRPHHIAQGVEFGGVKNG